MESLSSVFLGLTSIIFTALKSYAFENKKLLVIA